MLRIGQSIDPWFRPIPAFNTETSTPASLLAKSYTKYSTILEDPNEATN